VVDEGLLDVNHGHMVTRAGCYLGDAVSHLAGTQHGYAVYLHAPSCIRRGMSLTQSSSSN